MTSAEHGQMKREFGLRDAFTIALVIVSPIAAVYGVFGLVLMNAGPVGWWALLVVLVMQLGLAAVLGFMVSRWPIEGGSYQWAKRMVGPNYGWLTGWMYMWTFIIIIASCCYFVAGVLPPLFDLDPFTVKQQTLVALLILAFLTVLNVLGPRVLKFFLRLTFLVELIGSVGLATVLLIWHRNQPLSVVTDFDVLTDTLGMVPSEYLWMGFFMAVGVAGYSILGFESVCSLAEEIHDPRRNIPRAMVGAALCIGIIVMYSTLALILSIPDMSGAIAGEMGDPATGTIVLALGSNVAKPFLALIILGYLGAMVVAHNSVSRVLWSFARDKQIPGWREIVKLTGRHNYPVRALIASSLAVAVVTLSAFSDLIYTTLISGSTAGFFVTMALVVTALAHNMAKGRFRLGQFHLGALTPVFVAVAAVWTIFQVINLSWPRATDQAWHVTWAVPIGLALIAAIGIAVRVTHRGVEPNAESDEVPEREPELLL